MKENQKAGPLPDVPKQAMKETAKQVIIFISGVAAGYFVNKWIKK